VEKVSQALHAVRAGVAVGEFAQRGFGSIRIAATALYQSHHRVEREVLRRLLHGLGEQLESQVGLTFRCEQPNSHGPTHGIEWPAAEKISEALKRSGSVALYAQQVGVSEFQPTLLRVVDEFEF
jgi:hypothetical protein